MRVEMRILPLILSIVALATTAVVALELNARVREYREVVDEQQRALVKLCKEVASNRYLNLSNSDNDLWRDASHLALFHGSSRRPESVVERLERRGEELDGYREACERGIFEF